MGLEEVDDQQYNELQLSCGTGFSKRACLRYRGHVRPQAGEHAPQVRIRYASVS